MLEALIQLGLFAAKAIIIVLFILIALIVFALIISRSKEKMKGRLVIKNVNKKFEENTEAILTETASKKEYKRYHKEKKNALKAALKSKTEKHNVYVINFHGDMRASATEALREEITAVLNVATRADEVVVKIESGGGVVHGYGLAAAQLMRVRAANIPLTVTIDKIAASGGYLMACVGNKILAAPFSIIGSIGVVVQLPNFNRALKANNIDFEMHTAGEFKRTITLFGENTEEGRIKLQHEIEDIHQLFKNLITDYRPQIDIQKVATGEHWLGQQAIGLKLIDEIRTSDDYLLSRSKDAHVYEICYEIKKPLLSRFAGAASKLQDRLLITKQATYL